MRLPCLIVMLSCASAVANAPDGNTISTLADMREFHVEVKCIQIQGKPDWSWWTQGFTGNSSYDDGAGRVFGPVDATGFWKHIDFSRTGFPGVADDEPVVIGSPRAVWWLDHGEYLKRGEQHSLYKVGIMQEPPDTDEWRSDDKSPSPEVLSDLDGLYNSLSLYPKKLTRDDVESKALVFSIDGQYDKDGKFIMPTLGNGNGFLLSIEANSTGSPDVYRLEQQILVHKTKFKRPYRSRKWSEEFIRGQIECRYEVKDGSTTAFLLPVVDDEYLLLLSTFTLVPHRD